MDDRAWGDSTGFGGPNVVWIAPSYLLGEKYPLHLAVATNGDVYLGGCTYDGPENTNFVRKAF